ncbi:N-acetylglucosamine kinase [Egicoccus halophilus]|uniref:ATPase BadF/BadG/BcrA/BcrD type domain-containing protein n=1 Tax=Egicoccus halophilus TaxID=1670830 RepID=A0A8J3AFY6_9ACTN|nr:BadF/BadG/BcrA/BcrD ATPase family protein [Egicoccus halophilus]GGI08406.1 hypothetical protein GCM10011354_28930 [Egicoccus halophilus]
MNVLAADVGRTTCRLARFEGEGRTVSTEVPSGASLADPEGVERITAALEAAAARLPAAPRPDTVVVGTTGLAQAPTAAQRLADALARRHTGAEVVLASDVLTAHLGALAGHGGVCLIAGTGAVALAVDADTDARLVDGHGYLLGDAGSGFAVGRAGLAAALRSADGRPGGSQVLAVAATERFGPLAQLPGRVQSDPDAVRLVAGFSVPVADAARAGDVVAGRIWADAVTALADTTVAACHALDPSGTRTVPVGLAGSLLRLDDLVTAPLVALVTAACPRARLERARGDALDGARHLAGPLPGLDPDRLRADGLLLRSPRRDVPAHVAVAGTRRGNTSSRRLG